MSHLKRIEKLALSQNPYWFDVNSYGSPTEDRSFAVCRAYWFGRKNGRNTVTYGSYAFFPRRTDIKPSDSIYDQIDAADPLHGPHWTYRWDGVKVLVNSANTWITDLETQLEWEKVFHELLDRIEDPDFDYDIGVGWIGPYYKVKDT